MAPGFGAIITRSTNLVATVKETHQISWVKARASAHGNVVNFSLMRVVLIRNLAGMIDIFWCDKADLAFSWFNESSDFTPVPRTSNTGQPLTRERQQLDRSH
jgi:hypothetical protein